MQELDGWERSQGGLSSNASSSDGIGAVMRKDFDGAAWVSNHGSDFQRLIAQARVQSDASPGPGISLTNGNTRSDIAEDKFNPSNKIHKGLSKSSHIGVQQQGQHSERSPLSAKVKAPHQMDTTESETQKLRPQDSVGDFDHPG